jgi:hypothetical protein
VSNILLEQISPLGNVQAIVEADDDTVFFYLNGAPDTGLGVKSVWVRNLRPAPRVLDVGGMAKGGPPMNPAAHCRSTSGSALPAVESLTIVWLPEGNGAALFERGRMIAVIPPWSGESGFHGYSLECVGNGPLAWAMPEDPTLGDRFAAADDFWRGWEGDSWAGIRDGAIAAIERALGKHSHYYAIDGGKWPPRALVRVPTHGGAALITIGMALLPQPQIEMYTEDPRALRRVELGAFVSSEWNEEAVRKFGSSLSGHASLPWDRFTFVGQGHTIGCDAWRVPRFSASLLTRRHPALPDVTLPVLYGDPVTILWEIPITKIERTLAEEKGSESLLERLPPERWREA